MTDEHTIRALQGCDFDPEPEPKRSGLWLWAGAGLSIPFVVGFSWLAYRALEAVMGG